MVSGLYSDRPCLCRAHVPLHVLVQQYGAQIGAAWSLYIGGHCIATPCTGLECLATHLSLSFATAASEIAFQSPFLLTSANVSSAVVLEEAGRMEKLMRLVAALLHG